MLYLCISRDIYFPIRARIKRRVFLFLALMSIFGELPYSFTYLGFTMKTHTTIDTTKASRKADLIARLRLLVAATQNLELVVNQAIGASMQIKAAKAKQTA